MNICIYTKKSEPEVRFEKQEHIFPAALGGISCLPLGWVSDEVNEKFSKDLEIDFIRDSIISIPRQIFGPGSRGNINNINKATKSKIHILKDCDSNECSLGYIMLGKPHLIRQIIFEFDNMGNLCDSNKLIFPEDVTNIYDEIKKFMKLGDSISILKDNKIPKNRIIIGLHEYKEKGKGSIKNKWFIACNNIIKVNEDLKFKLKERIKKIYSNSENKEFDLTSYASNFESYQNLIIDIEKLYRTLCKIAFNFMASILGRDFVLKKEFDDIRNYILCGGRNIFVIYSNRDIMSKFLHNKEHVLFLNLSRDSIYILITLYGELEFVICIPYNSDEYLFCTEKGCVIDWKGRRELNLLKYFEEKEIVFEYTFF